MAKKSIKINRAPVLTLWAAVVAERLGHDRDAALTLGRAVAGLNAQSKGRRLGIYEEQPEEEEEQDRKQQPPAEQESVQLLGRAVPAVRTPRGLRAAEKGQPVSPESVARYLRQKFGGDLDEVRAAMQALAESYSPEDLARRAYGLYEQFRPEIPEGTRGWGARGDLDLEHIRSLSG